MLLLLVIVVCPGAVSVSPEALLRICVAAGAVPVSPGAVSNSPWAVSNSPEAVPCSLNAAVGLAGAVP